MAKLGAVVLAGGESKRFRSGTPKVVHPLLGRPLIAHVLGALRELHRTARLSSAVVVVPPGKVVEPVVGSVRYPFPVRFAVQRRPLGTGDAAKVGLSKLDPCDEVLIVAGDSPLIEASTLATLVRERRSTRAPLALATAVLDDPGPYGRVLRSNGAVTGVMEARDAIAELGGMKEINTSIYVFDRRALTEVLPKLRTENAQSEYYLTDAIGLLARNGGGVVAVQVPADEALGTNTRGELALVADIMRRRILHGLMDAGVTIVDPSTTYADAGVTVGADTVIRPNTYLEGTTKIGSRCDIGPSVRLIDTTVGDDARITFAVANQARIGPQAEVGPFASLRPGTVLRRGAKAGTFVEMKAADIGEGSKVPHLAYMGDVKVGKGSNVGAGTITCNYDGERKHPTTIGDDVFIGSDTVLVAPVRVGRGAYTGAGSVVNRDVKPGELVYGVPARPKPRRRKPKPKKKGEQ